MFLVFAYDDYDANGGLRDCRAVCVAQDEAKEKAEGMLAAFEHIHILDVATATVHHSESHYGLVWGRQVITYTWEVSSLTEFMKS